MGCGMMNELMCQVNDLWVRQSKTYSVGLCRVANTRPIIQNQTNRASRSWN
jgi:hypothetical protein